MYLQYHSLSKSEDFNVLYTRTTDGVKQLVEALRYKPEDRGFDFRWCHWDFSLT